MWLMFSRKTRGWLGRGHAPCPSQQPGREKASPQKGRRAKGLESLLENLAKAAKAQSVVDDFFGGVKPVTSGERSGSSRARFGDHDQHLLGMQPTFWGQELGRSPAQLN